MNRREAERLNRQRDTLVSLGFTPDEAESLRRISMTLHRWYELECGNDRGCIERGHKNLPNFVESHNFVSDENGAPYWANHSAPKPYYTRIPDRERGALKRLAAILKARNERPRFVQGRGFAAEPGPFSSYIQTDPRGAALYILRPGDVPEGEDASAYYSRGICVY